MITVEQLKGHSEQLTHKLDELVATWQTEKTSINETLKHYAKILGSDEAKTDRSENAVFQDAKDNYDVAMGRLVAVQAKLDAYSANKSDYTPDGSVKRGSTVAFRPTNLKSANVTDNFIMKLVVDDLCQPEDGLLSEESPVGCALLGHTKGDSVNVHTMLGNIEYFIEEIY